MPDLRKLQGPFKRAEEQFDVMVLGEAVIGL